MMKFNDYYNKKAIEFLVKPNTYIKEDVGYVPRFSLKDIEIFKDLPVNEPVKYTEELFIKAIQYGLILNLDYKGAKDSHFSGHQRSVYPMVIGKSSKGKTLIRGFHLRGWSVSSNRHVDKVWRLFRADRILNITFTGSFYRLPPNGYVENDSIMRGGITAYADFNTIRKNQSNLLNAQKIQNKEDVTIGQNDAGNIKFNTIKVKETKTILDLNNPLDNEYLNKIKDQKNLRLTFVKSVYGNKYICVLGALGEPNTTVKLLNERNVTLGVFRVLDSINGSALKKIKKVKGQTTYDVVIFESKI